MSVCVVEQCNVRRRIIASLYSTPLHCCATHTVCCLTCSGVAVAIVLSDFRIRMYTLRYACICVLVCVYARVHACQCAYIRVYVHVSARIYAHWHACTHVYTPVHACQCAYMRAHACQCVYIRVYMHVNARVYACTCMSVRV